MTETVLPRDFRALAAVAAGGVAGAVSRWGLVEMFPVSTGWPWAVFVANILGSFLLGALAASLLRQRSAPVYLALATGFCGALTTFSAFAVDTAALLRDQRTTLAITYALASLVLGLIAVLAGRRMATQAGWTGGGR